MMICAECLTASYKAASWVEPHGERMSGCPRCGGVMEEAGECLMCGDLLPSSELVGGFCQRCIEEGDLDD